MCFVPRVYRWGFASRIDQVQGLLRPCSIRLRTRQRSRVQRVGYQTTCRRTDKSAFEGLGAKRASINLVVWGSCSYCWPALLECRSAKSNTGTFAANAGLREPSVAVNSGRELRQMRIVFDCRSLQVASAGFVTPQRSCSVPAVTISQSRTDLALRLTLPYCDRPL